MRSWHLGVFLLFVTLSGSASAESVNRPDVNRGPELDQIMASVVNPPVVYQVPGMDKARVYKDLSYKSSDDSLLKMDVYVPPDLSRGERRPAVVFIHGSFGSAQFRPKDWGIYVSRGRLIAASGMIGVTFTHRLDGLPKFLRLTEAASDVSDALSYIRANADSLNIDKDRLCLAAYSAGGPLLSLAMRDAPEYVRCLVAFYSYLDIQQLASHLDGTPEEIKNFSPITYLSTNARKIAPIFIARAGFDTVPTLNDSIDRFIREALAKNVTIDLANHPQGGHGFDNQDDDERSREIIRRVIEFMQTHLGVMETKSNGVSSSLDGAQRNPGASGIHRYHGLFPPDCALLHPGYFTGTIFGILRPYING